MQERPFIASATSIAIRVLALALLAGCVRGDAAPQPPAGADDWRRYGALSEEAAAAEGLALATFAGGCFWCMEPPFDELDGVLATVSGYAGGAEERPTYDEVSSGGTGHAEVVRVVYDPRRVTYARLLEVFWHNVDPTVEDRQFCDWGRQYRTAIFAHGEEQKRQAEATKREVAAELGVPIVTSVEAAGAFWPAEEYHQDFYRKSSVRYRTYRLGCGRDARLRELWGEDAGH